MKTVTCTAKSACHPARVRHWLHSWHLYLILITVSQLGQRHKDTDKEAANNPSSSVVLPSVCQKCVSMSCTKLIYSRGKKAICRKAKDNVLDVLHIFIQGSVFIISWIFVHKSHVYVIYEILPLIPSTHTSNSMRLSQGSSICVLCLKDINNKGQSSSKQILLWSKMSYLLDFSPISFLTFLIFSEHSSISLKDIYILYP